MTAYGYVRCSTIEQASDEKTSIQTQERAITGVAMMRGHPAPQMFTDVGVSGATALNVRPAGKVMLKTLKRGDLLIVSKMDRIFRSQSDATATADDFKKRGVDLILVDMGTEPVTQNGVSQLFFGMMAAFAEFERWRIAERMADGKRGKAARGGHVGGSAPYGFRKIGDGKDARLVVEPTEKIVVGRIKALRAKKLGFAAILRDFAENEITNRAGKPFDERQLRRIAGRSA